MSINTAKTEKAAEKVKQMQILLLQRSAAALGFLAVALGAFGAHALHDMLSQAGRLETWETASQYHLVHSVVLLWLSQLLAAREDAGCSAAKQLRFCAFVFLAGTLIFSGSLYLLCLTGQRWLGAITPLGGLLLLAGWLSLAFSAPAARRNGRSSD